MYGLWYLTFGFLTIAAITFGLWIYSDRMWDKWYDETERIHNKWVHCNDYDECKALESARKRARNTTNSYENAEVTSAVVCILSTIIGGGFLLFSIFLPIGAKREVEYFKVQSEYVEMAVENGTDLENIAITQTVIDQNEWLAYAKAHVAAWGTWSRYYGTDLENLEPIVIER